MAGIFDSDPEANIFTTYAGQLRFRNKIMGATPKDPSILLSWLRMAIGVSERSDELRLKWAETMQELGREVSPNPSWEEVEATSKEMALTQQTVGFKVDERGPYIESRIVKAMLKESTNILFAGAEKWGKTRKGPKSAMAEWVQVRPDRIWLGVPEPTGIELFIGHPSGPKGVQSNLSYYEYIERATVDFRVDVLLDRVGSKEWKQIWRNAQEQGLGALRSQGYGTFEILKWEPVEG